MVGKVKGFAKSKAALAAFGAGAVAGVAAMVFFPAAYSWVVMEKDKLLHNATPAAGA